jgi:sarcosine oxidase delta subunit
LILDVDDREKDASKLGERWEHQGSLLGCFHFLAAAKRYCSDRQKVLQRAVKSISAAAKNRI